MENSVRNSHVPETLDPPHTLYVVDKPHSVGLKRNRQPSSNGEFGFGQTKKKKRKKKKKRPKELSLSSFQTLSNKTQNHLDDCELDKARNAELSGQGLFKDANVVPIPNRPRCFTRRKNLETNPSSLHLGDDKLAHHSVTPTSSSETRPNKASVDNSSSRENLAQIAKAQDPASPKYTDIVTTIVRRNRGKRKISKEKDTGVDRIKASDDKIPNPCENLKAEDEENLEENAARMLSSRFDPNCTASTGNGVASASQPVNGLSVGSPMDFVSPRSNHLTIDAASRLRPRRRDGQKRNKRKRRHFYEMFYRNVDAYWVVNRRIKVFWPLDQSWYFGLVTSYDPHRKLHHVKYDDRDEEWINLQNERFKLLLLPSEAPRKPGSGNLVSVSRSVSEDEGRANKEEDDNIESYLETEPIILWLARSARRVKSSLLGVMKRRNRHCRSKNIATAMLSEDSVTPLSGSFVDGTIRADANKISGDSVVLDKSDDKEASETCCSKDRMPRFIYSRKRFRQRGRTLGCASDNSQCRSIVTYDPHMYSVERFRPFKENDVTHQCFSMEDLIPGSVLWNGENLRLVKLMVAAMNSMQVTLGLSTQLQFADYVVGAENLWMCHTLLLLQYGTLVVVWPKVRLEMLFVDNVVGLRCLLFEGCLMQAVAFVFLVLVAFHELNENGELLDQQIPVTSIRFEISGFPRFRRRFIFVLYNFVEVKNSKWLYLDKKLKFFCSVTKQLPLSECTYENIRILQGRSSLLPLPSVCRETVSLEGSRKRARKDNMSKRIAKESAYVNMGLSSSSFSGRPNRIPQFHLPFSAAPTFFLNLHLKLLMAKNVASVGFCNPLLLLGSPESCGRSVTDGSSLVEDLPVPVTLDNNMGGPESCGRSVTDGSSLVEDLPVPVTLDNNMGGPESCGKSVTDGSSLVEDLPVPVTVDNNMGGPESCGRSVSDGSSLVEDLPVQITLDNSMDCSFSRIPDVCGLLSTAESEVDVDVMSMKNEEDLAITSQKCLNDKLNADQASVVLLDPGRGETSDIVVVQEHSCHLLDSQKCAASSWPPAGEDHSSMEKRDSEFMCHLNDIKVQIPTVKQAENQSCDEEMQGAHQSTSDTVWGVNDCAIRSPNPTAPRSVWNHNRQNSGSSSFGYRSKVWPDERAELSHNGMVNGSRKPRSQISYMLPFGNYDFSSKPRSHHRKGRPYKRMRIDSEKTLPNDSVSLQKSQELACDVNVLITAGDRGWRESGAHVVLECIDHNEWRLLVKVSDVTKYSYKAYQFLQPGTTNRYTHAMMWKGGKDWILEFPDRSQWTLFKEMHEECYNRNLRAASIKTIPIPGVRLIEEIDDNVVEVPFIRSSAEYFLQVETDVDMALNPSRILYDMDSDDEKWISKHRASQDASVSGLMDISEDIFEKTMDMLEKVAYTQQRQDFTADEIEEFIVGIPIDLIRDIYGYWKQKRHAKGMPLIRQLQLPQWEMYQQKLKEWELGLNKIHHLPNGCKEKAMLLEKPPMYAFCLKPRGLEVPNKGSKQRTHRKVSAGGHGYGFSRDSDGHHVFGRKSNGFVCGEERFPTSSNNEYASSWQMSTRVISPRDAINTGYLSMSSDGSERSQHRKLHRSKSKKMGTFVPPNESQMVVTSYNQSLVSKRNGASRLNVGLPEWPSQNQYQRERFQRHKVEKLGGPDLDEFRLRDASSAAQHASNMAKLKREKAHRLFYRADVAIHKAMVAIMTAEAIKASSQDSAEDG